jgi:hypothetical protein
MRLFVLPSLIFAMACTLALPARGQTDWEAMLVQMGETNPELVAQWEKAKKDAEENEKDLKKAADKHFQSSFDNVFGKDNFKPSSGLEMLKVLEAISVGDIDYAGEAGANALIASYMPGLGQYITVMKAVAGGIKAAEQVWIQGLHSTKAYNNFIDILYDQPTLENAYIPSYMITYLRNNKQLGPQISGIYDEMRAREDAMFGQWASDDAAVDQMFLPGWASRWISARGKVPDQREMFNYFLYNSVRNNKPTYMRRFYDQYIDPLLQQQARAERRKIAAVMAQALAGISNEMQGGQEDQCPALISTYKNGAATVKQKRAQLAGFYKQVQSTWKARRNTALDGEAAVQHRRWAPLIAEEERLREERPALEARMTEFKSLEAELSSLKQEIESLNARFDPDTRDAANEAILRESRSKNAAFSRRFDGEYTPLRQELKSAVADFKARESTLKSKQEAMRNAPLDKSRSSGVSRGTKRTRDAIQVYARDGSQCAVVSQAMAQDNLAGKLGLDPSAAIANCTQMMEALTKTNVVAKQARDLGCRQ